MYIHIYIQYDSIYKNFLLRDINICCKIIKNRKGEINTKFRIMLPLMRLGGEWVERKDAQFTGTTVLLGFLGSSVSKESACNARDPASIPGLGRSNEEGIGYPLQYSWASLVAQLVKNLPAMWKTWVRSLNWEGHLEKGMATHSSILTWRL